MYLSNRIARHIIVIVVLVLDFAGICIGVWEGHSILVLAIHTIAFGLSLALHMGSQSEKSPPDDKEGQPPGNP